MTIADRLTAYQRRYWLKTVLRFGGILVAFVGFLYAPHPGHDLPRPERAPMWHVAIDSGEFTSWALAGAGLGAVLIGASFLVRVDLSE